VPVFQLVEMAIVLGVALWGLVRVIVRPPGFFSYFVIAIVALWEGLELVPTLVNGFVLIALPPFAARAATVVALGSGLGLLLMVFRLAAQRVDARPRAREPLEAEDESDWELA
jgi:hypothetical protein